jgi:hypothetical protein
VIQNLEIKAICQNLRIRRKKKERCGHSGLLFVYKAGGWAGPFVLDVDRPGVEAEFAFNTKPKQ